MKFKTLFSIGFTHEYFSGGGDYLTPEMDKYLELVPSEKCLAFLKKYRLVLRKNPSKISCISTVIDTASNYTFIPKRDLNFRFYLKIKDSNFLQFTDFTSLGFDLNKIFQGIFFPHFKGQNGGPISLDKYEHYQRDSFKISENPTVNDCFFIKGFPIPNLKKSNFTIDGLTPKPTITKYDTDQSKIIFNGKAHEGKMFGLSYRAIPKWDSTIFGIVDITVKGENLNFDEEYKISFKAKESEWKYYVISKTNALKIKQESDLIKFKEPELLTDNDPLYQRMRDSFPEADTLFYKLSSTNKVKYHSKPKPQIKLMSGDETLVANLPNPTPANNGIEIINIYS